LQNGDVEVHAYGDDKNHRIKLDNKLPDGRPITWKLCNNWTAAETWAQCIEVPTKKIYLRDTLEATFGKEATDTFIDDEPWSLEPDGVSGPPVLRDRLKKTTEKKEMVSESQAAAAAEIDKARHKPTAPTTKKRRTSGAAAAPPPGTGLAIVPAAAPGDAPMEEAKEEEEAEEKEEEKAKEEEAKEEEEEL
jgi:hypothetical protein